MKFRTIKLSAIVVDRSIQPRATLDDDVVSDYAQVLIDGRELPPIDVFHVSGTFLVADGYHRFAAHVTAHRDKIACTVHEGTARDALLFAAGANQQHGLRRTNADKRRAVSLLLADDVIATWPDRRLADTAGVSHTFVAQLRGELATVATPEHVERDPVTRTTRTADPTESDTADPSSSPAAEPESAQATADADRGGVSLFDAWLAFNVRWWNDHDVPDAVRLSWLENAALRGMEDRR